MVGHPAFIRVIRLRPSPLAWIYRWTLLLIENRSLYMAVGEKHRQGAPYHQ
jgi:hypothetical protein